jgi:Ser/Thr protein kinase RdoA (MazF antagonist)
MDTDDHEQPMLGGSVTDVVRIGNTVHRAAGAWTPAVHALLRHLEHKGFAASPRVLGIDASGREILSYIDGAAAMRAWPEALLTEAGITALGRLIASYHRAVADFQPRRGATWRVGAIDLRPGEIIRHGDLGPWNTIWREHELVGLIDWDFAEPGTALDELSQAAWDSVPLRDDVHARECGFAGAVDRRARLAALCLGYGGQFAPSAVVTALLSLQRREAERMVERGGRGEMPWSLFLARGGNEAVMADNCWLEAHAAELA